VHNSPIWYALQIDAFTTQENQLSNKNETKRDNSDPLLDSDISRVCARRQDATEEQIGNFKKAFSVCLEAKDYLVKY
jgi:hypothetical protein